MPDTQYLTDSDGCFVTDARGHLVPSAQHQRALDAQTRNLASVRAAAEDRLLQQHGAESGYDHGDVDSYLSLLGLDVHQKIRVKRTIEREGRPIEQVLASLNLAPLPSPSRIAAAREAAGVAQMQASAAMVARVEPHARAVEALADRLQAGAIGLADPGGHVQHFRRIAGEMRASAAAGVLPHTVGYDPAVGRVMGSTSAASAAAPVASPMSNRVAAALSGMGLPTAARDRLVAALAS